MWKPAGLALLIVAFGDAAGAQNVVFGDVLALQGDALGAVDGAVTDLGTPTTNGNGEVAFLVKGYEPSSGSTLEYVYRSGTRTDLNATWFDLGPSIAFDTVTLVEIGYSNAGSLGWLPTVNSLQHPLYYDGAETLADDGTASLPPDNRTIVDLRRPHVVPGGALYAWADTSFDDYIVRSGDGTTANAVVFFSEGDPITLDSTSLTVQNILPTFDVADNDAHLAAIVTVDEDFDTRVIDGSDVVAREGVAIGPTTKHWASFDMVAIDSAGASVVGGENEDGAEVLGFFTAGSPTATLSDYLVEGDGVDSITLGNQLQSVSINDAGEVAFLWSGALFVACDPSDLLGQTHLALQIGDGLDADGDGVVDHAVAGFPVTIGAPAFDLANSSSITLELLLDGGDDAVVTIPYSCSCTGDRTSQDLDLDGICGNLDQCPGQDDTIDVNPADGIPDCLEGIFSDGFESNGTSAWSATVP